METSICIGKRGLLSVFVCLFASAFLSVSCAENDTESSPSGETASLTVTLNRQAAGSKAVVPSDGAGAEDLKKAENTVKNVTVFVFNANGTLDKKQTFASSSFSETITGLIAGTKKVVVVANVPSGVRHLSGRHQLQLVRRCSECDGSGDPVSANERTFHERGRDGDALGQFYRRDNRIRQPCRR